MKSDAVAPERASGREQALAERAPELVEPHFGGEPTEVCRYHKAFRT